MPRKNPCSEMSSLLTSLAMNVAEDPSIKDIDGVLAVLQKDIPELNREILTNSITEATTGYEKTANELRDKLTAIKREARRDASLRKAALRLEEHLKAGTRPVRPPRKPTAAETKALQDNLNAKRAELRQSDPNARKKVEARIAELEAHKAAGTVPAKKPRKAAPADLEALREQRNTLAREVAQADPAKRDAIRAKIAEVSKHIRDGTYPEPAPAKTQPDDIQALNEELAAARAELRKYDPKVREKLRAEIAELQGHLDAGTLPPRTPREVAEVPEDVLELREARKAIQDALANSEPALREKYTADIEELTQRLEDGVRPGVKKPERILSDDIEKLIFKKDLLKSKIRAELEAMKPKTIWGRTWSAVSEPFNAMRAVMTSLDLSAVLRQGGFIALGNPVRAARALKPMFQAFADPSKSHAINSEIIEGDRGHIYKRAGLYLAPDGNASRLSTKEEAYMSRWVEKIPGVAGSQRAYVTFLNKLRADSFDAMASTLAVNGAPTDAEAKAIANYINVATGRGAFPGSWENAAQALNTVFFAPRYVASRFQLMAGPARLALPEKYGGLPPRARKLIAKEYAKFIAGLGVVYLLGKLAGGELEDDPRSSDFGKIKFGNTRLDPLAGLAQANTLVARLVSGETKNLKGKVKPLGVEGPFNSSRLDVAARFARSKLSPVAGAVVDLMDGENVVGEKVTVGSVAKRLVVPMQYDSLLASFEEQGIPRGTALAILSIFGMGVNRIEGK